MRGRTSLSWLVALLAVVGMLAPAAAAMPGERATMTVEGTYDSHGEVVVERSPSGKRVTIRTAGFEGDGIVTCTNAVCGEWGYDGTVVEALRDLEIVIGFKGTDEELQAVKGRSRGLSIFTDGFESGDLTRVTGTAQCSTSSEGTHTCAVDLRLRGRLTGPDLTGRIDLMLTSVVTIAGDTGTWAIVDWLGSLEAQK